MAAAAAAISWWHRWRSDVPVGVLNVLVVVSFAVTAALLYADPQQRATARQIGASAVLYLVSWGWGWPDDWQRYTPAAALTFVVSYLWFVLLGAALTRYPQARLRRRDERVVLWAFGAWVVGVKTMLLVTGRAEWTDFAAVAWWPSVAPDRTVFEALDVVFQSGLVLFVMALLVLLAVKIHRGVGVDRVDAAPAVVAASTIALAGVAYLGVRIADLPAAVSDTLRVGTACAALAVPLSFLVVAVRRQTIRAAAADLLPRICAVTSPRGLQEEARLTLRDPDLRLRLWDPDGRRYLDAGGDQEDREPERAEARVHVRTSTGAPLAVISMRAALRRHTALVSATAYALGIAVERRAALEGIDRAERSARRALTRDLHDGAQQVLLSALLRLALARRAAGTASSGQIDQARADVESALTIIRNLVRGGAPARPGRLAGSLADLTRDLDLLVEVEVAVDELPEPLERAIWFVVSEAMTNVRKHASASAAAVTVDRGPGGIEVRVVDDGEGGAAPVADGGLAGMIERVETLGGTLDIESPPGGGTTLTARLPCG